VAYVDEIATSLANLAAAGMAKDPEDKVVEVMAFRMRGICEHRAQVFTGHGVPFSRC
jgi:hypothetical protein